MGCAVSHLPSALRPQAECRSTYGPATGGSGWCGIQHPDKRKSRGWVGKVGLGHFGRCSPAPEWGPGNESCQLLVAMGLWADILLLHAAVLRESHSTWPQEGPVVILDA